MRENEEWLNITAKKHKISDEKWSKINESSST